MISFPALWVLYGFYLIGGLLLLLALFYLLNGLRHGSHLALTAVSSGIYLVGLVLIVWAAVSLLGQVDWSGTFSFTLPSIQLMHLGS